MEKGTLYGMFVRVEGKCTAEQLEDAKETLVNRVCDAIREIAAKNDDFFIIKDSSSMPIFEEEYTSVACKFFLPTVNDPEEITIPVSTYIE